MHHYEREQQALRRINDTLLAYGFTEIKEDVTYADVFELIAECLLEMDEKIQSAPDPALLRHAEQDTCNDMDAKDTADARQELWEGNEYWSRR